MIAESDTEEGTTRRPFHALAVLRKLWEAQHGPDLRSREIHDLVQFHYNSEFAPVLSSIVGDYNAGRLLGGAPDPTSPNSGGGEVATLEAELSKVQESVRSNIQQVLDRGAVLEDVEEGTRSLSSQAKLFQKSSQELRQMVFWKRLKGMARLGGVVVVFGLLLAISNCGATFSDCG